MRLGVVVLLLRVLPLLKRSLRVLPLLERLLLVRLLRIPALRVLILPVLILRVLSLRELPLRVLPPVPLGLPHERPHHVRLTVVLPLVRAGLQARRRSARRPAAGLRLLLSQAGHLLGRGRPSLALPRRQPPPGLLVHGHAPQPSVRK
ncbi:hypothetical protein GCM10009839_83680 [Catenulispora yoronensis]|uniref:Secreted protein n=1 Tax=Catenulispora yoronensis TaxID=450799 RepID=A0ABP5H193_9ACTN